MLKTCTTKILMTVLAISLGTVAVAGAAERPALRLLNVEQELLGSAASRTWQTSGPGDMRTFDQVGGEGMDEPERVDDEIGGSTAAAPSDTTGSSNTGRKVAAGAMSAVIPGAGQFYNGEKNKAYIMFGVEVAIWATWFIFDTQADNRQDDAKDWAAIYAGAGGTDEDYYWRAVGRYDSSDDFNEDLMRQARASDEPLPGAIGPAQDWMWVNDERKAGYRQLYDDADSAYTTRDYVIIFAIINRVVSIVDAVVGAGKGEPGTLDTDVMGMNLGVEVNPSWHDPGARAVLSRSF